MRQRMLFEGPKSLDERFAEMMATRPEIYAEFVRICQQLRGRGREKYSAKGVTEIVRWHRVISGLDSDGYKINNSMVSRLARKYLDDFPDQAGFFELRELKTGETED